MASFSAVPCKIVDRRNYEQIYPQIEKCLSKCHYIALDLVSICFCYFILVVVIAIVIILTSNLQPRPSFFSLSIINSFYTYNCFSSINLTGIKWHWSASTNFWS